jgi:hypothetical protein
MRIVGFLDVREIRRQALGQGLDLARRSREQPMLGEDVPPIVEFPARATVEQAQQGTHARRGIDDTPVAVQFLALGCEICRG